MSASDMQTTIRKATRLENLAPKTKHLLALKNMTLDAPASIDDILMLLEKRLKERSWIITFKVFIILHYMMREGNCVRVVDAVMKRQSVLEASKIKHKAQTQADIENIHMYKNYIDERIIAFRHTRRDYAIDEAKFSYMRRNSAIGGRRLSQISIKEGLFKEMKALQRQMNAILQCKFVLDDSRKASDITCFAFRMVFDDLLTLFQSVNEGISNILDHYSDMKKSDAQTALEIYKRFAHQTELTMDYLKHVRMIQNELQIRDVPTQLKHAPLSMTAALQEYVSKAKEEDDVTETGVKQKQEAPQVSGEEATQQVSGQPQPYSDLFSAFQQQTVPSSAAISQQQTRLPALIQPDTAISNYNSPYAAAVAVGGLTATTTPTPFVDQLLQQQPTQYAQQPQQQFLMQKSLSEPQQQIMPESLLDDAFSTANRVDPLRDAQILRQASMPTFNTYTMSNHQVNSNTNADALMTSPLPSPTSYSSNPFASMMTPSNSSSTSYSNSAGPYSAVGLDRTATTATMPSLTDSMSTINSMQSLMSVGSMSGNSTPHHNYNPFRSFSLNTTTAGTANSSTNSSAVATPLNSANDYNKTTATMKTNPFFPASPPLTPNNPLNSTFMTQLHSQQVKSTNNNPFSQTTINNQVQPTVIQPTVNNSNHLGF